MGKFMFIKVLAVVFTVSLVEEFTFLEGTLMNKNWLVTQATTPSFHLTKSTTEGNGEHFLTPSVPDQAFVREDSVTFFPEQFFPSSVQDDSLVENVFSIDVEAPIRTMLSFCKTTHTCQHDTLKHGFEIGGKCCLPCDCSERCYVAGNCCLDMTNGSRYLHNQDSPLSTTEETCANIVVSGAGYNSKTYINSSYMLIQNCNDDVEYQWREKCLRPNVFDLEEMIPVFSQRTNRHYRNVFCSKCNNDSQNLVLWQTQLICNQAIASSYGLPKLSDVENFSILDFISINPNCSLIWTPPTNVGKADRCFLEENTVSDCNNPSLDNLCKQYYAPVESGNVIYRNVFCMECANPSGLKGDYLECLDMIYEISEVPFTSILSLNIDQQVPSKTSISEVNICDFPKKYNNELEACFHYTCAVTKLNVAGVCKPVFSHLSGIHLEYRLTMIYRTNIMEHAPSDIFDSNIFAVINIDMDRLCFAEVLDMKYSPESFEISIVYIRAVSNVNIKHAYNEYVKGIESYNEMVKDNKTTYLLQIYKSGFEPIDEHAVTFAKFNSNSTHMCFNNIAMSKLQFCDTITFYKDEFIIHGNESVSIGNLMFGPGEFVPRQTQNGTITYVQVCLDDYITAYRMTDRNYDVNSAAENGGRPRSRSLLLVCALILLRQFCSD